MVNPSHDTPVCGARPDANSPYPNARVIVYHCPASPNTATCPDVSNETWFVYPEQVSTTAGDPAPVGTLHTSVKGVPGVNAGEFRMPFSFKISLLN
jgi:hypothetical protein